MKSRFAISSVPRCSSRSSSTSSSRADSAAAIESGTPSRGRRRRAPARAAAARLHPRARPRLRDAAQELDDALRRLALQQVAGGAAADRGEQVLLGAGGGEDDDLAVRGGLAKPRQRAEPVEARHREVEQDEVGLELGRAAIASSPSAASPTTSKPCCVSRAGERVAGQRVVVDDQRIALCHRSKPYRQDGVMPTRVNMRQDGQETISRPGSSARSCSSACSGLRWRSFSTNTNLPHARSTLPQLRLVLQTVMAFAGGHRRACSPASATPSRGGALDLLLSTGFFVAARVDARLHDRPGARAGNRSSRPRRGSVSSAAALGALIAARAVRTRSQPARRRSANAIIARLLMLLLAWMALRSAAATLPTLD